MMSASGFEADCGRVHEMILTASGSQACMDAVCALVRISAGNSYRDCQYFDGMPVQWTIDAHQKLVAMVDALREADAHGYRKLYDGRRSRMRMTREDVLALGARIRAEYKRSAMGPMAVVLPDRDADVLAPLLGMVAAADRPLRIFATTRPALRWLLALPSVLRSIEPAD